MDTKKIAYFLEIVKTKSIAKAAKNLGIDQSILSRSLRSLEEDLKTNLYIHFDKTFKLTEKGKVAHKYFKKIIGTCFDLEDSLSNIEDSQRIELKVLSSNGTVNFYLINSLPPFLKENSNIFLSFSTNDLIQKLDVGIDICIGPKIEGEDIETFYLSSYFLKLFASKPYLEKMGHPKTPQDLDHHQLIAYSREDISTFIDFDWHLRYGASNGVPRKPYLQISSSYGIQKAANSHLGIVSFSTYLVNKLYPDLIDIFPNEKGLKVDIYFSHRRHKDNEKAILLYRDFLFKYFRSLPFHDE